MLAGRIAGKDRTGVAAALVLALARLPPAYISREYALTRIGVEPVREFLTAKLKMGKDLDVETSPFLRVLASCRYVLVLKCQLIASHMLTENRADTMISMLEKLEEVYGGVEGYAMRELGFSTEDINRMRANLKDTVV